MEMLGYTGRATQQVRLINQENEVAEMKREEQNGWRARVSCGEEGILRRVVGGRTGATGGRGKKKLSGEE